MPQKGIYIIMGSFSRRTYAKQIVFPNFRNLMKNVHYQSADKMHNYTTKTHKTCFGVKDWCSLHGPGCRSYLDGSLNALFTNGNSLKINLTDKQVIVMGRGRVDVVSSPCSIAPRVVLIHQTFASQCSAVPPFRLLSITMTVPRVSGGCLLARNKWQLLEWPGRTVGPREGVDSRMFIAGYSTPMIDATFWFWSPSALRRRPLCTVAMSPPSRTHSHTTPTTFITGPHSSLVLEISGQFC